MNGMDGRVCVVTGATTGIGRVAATALAGLGATVVIVGRDAARAEDTRREIAARTGDAKLQVVLADLSVQAEVRRAAAEILAAQPRVHVLLNNAGAIFGQRQLTPDGIERTFALDHLAYFLLTHLLLDRLRESGGARIVNVASLAHRRGDMDFSDLQYARRYDGQRAYARAKLANILFTHELARRLEGTGVTANCMHPGTVATGFGETGPLAWRVFFRYFRFLLRTPEQGADTAIWLASSPEVANVSGRYFVDRKEARSSPLSHDRTVERRLWEESARLCGV